MVTKPPDETPGEIPMSCPIGTTLYKEECLSCLDESLSKPRIFITSPLDGSTVNKNIVTIKGITQNNDEDIELMNRFVQNESSGRFQDYSCKWTAQIYPLNEGENTIRVYAEAKDYSLKSDSYSITITYDPTSQD